MGEATTGELNFNWGPGFEFIIVIMLYCICTFRRETAWVLKQRDLGLIPICELSIFVTLDKLMNISKPHFPHP